MAARVVRVVGVGDADWLWVLDGAVEPAPSMLERLVAATAAPVPLDLVTGSVLGADGAPDAHWSPWFRTNPTERAMTAAPLGLVPVRAASGPVLVRALLAEAIPPPRATLGAGGAMLEWTARLLRAAEGYWARDCVGTLMPSAPTRPAGRRAATALVAGSAFTGVERVRVAVDLAF